MGTTAHSKRRAGLAALATAAMVAGFTTYGAGTATADGTFAFDRVAGVAPAANRFGTSVEAAKKYGNSADVILANGTNGHYPDALTANYLAGSKNAPVLLTQKDSTPSVVSDYLKSSGVKNITVIGDQNSVSDQQVNALTNAGYSVNRLAGPDRYATAKAVIGAVGGTSPLALLARGNGFADAVAGGPLSYGAGLPLAITKPDSLPQDTIDALKAAGVTQVIILGDTNSVSNAVVAQLAANQITVKDRVAGADRAETSTKLAAYELTNYASDFDKTRVNVASGQESLQGADALSGGPVSGKEKRPLLITKNSTVAGDALTAYLKTNTATLTGTDNHIFGDTNAVSDAVQKALEAAGRGETAAPTITNAALTFDAPGLGIPPATNTLTRLDTITLTFSAPVVSTDGLISLADADGDTFKIHCSNAPTADDLTDATCNSLGAPGAGATSLFITLLEDGTVTGGAGDGVANYPATITDITGIADADGNAVDLAGSSDKVIDGGAGAPGLPGGGLPGGGGGGLPLPLPIPIP